MNTQVLHLDNVLRLSTSAADLPAHGLYKLVIALPNGKGITVHTTHHVSDFKENSQLLVRAGQFMIAKESPHKGLWGIVPPEHDGALAPRSYHVFDLAHELHPDYFSIYITTPAFGRAVFKAARKNGHLFLRDFKAIPIWLPSLDEQQRIVEMWQAGQDMLRHTTSMVAEMEKLKRIVATDLLAQVNPAWENTTLGKCAVMTTQKRGLFPLVVTGEKSILLDSAIPLSGVGISPHADLSATFLYYWLESNLVNGKVALTDIPIHRLTAFLESMPLVLPTLYEQQKIASILQMQDNAITAMREEHEALGRLLVEMAAHVCSGMSLPSTFIMELSRALQLGNETLNLRA